MSSPTHAPHHPPENKKQRSRLVPIRFFSTRSLDPPPHAHHDHHPKKHDDDEHDDDTRPAPIFGARYRGNRRKPQTIRKTVNEDFHIVLIASGILCFNAGYINVVTMNSYLATTTSHVTGLVAKTGLLLGDGQWDKVYLPATTWAAFLFGAFLAGILITYQSFYLGRGYGRALLLISLIQGVALIVAVTHDRHSSFSTDSWVHHHYIYACAVGCGLQNGLTTKYSGNVVRTTHLTGATTDLGVVLGHIAKGKLNEVWKAQLHGTAVIGFLIGGVCGMRAYLAWQEYSLALNVALTGTLGMAHIIWLSWHENKHVMDIWASTADIPVHKPISRSSSDNSLGASRDKHFQHMHPHGHHSWASSHMESVPEAERESSDGDIIPMPMDSEDDALSEISEHDVAYEAEQEKDDGQGGIFAGEGERKEEERREEGVGGRGGGGAARGGVEMTNTPYGKTHPHTRV